MRTTPALVGAVASPAGPCRCAEERRSPGRGLSCSTARPTNSVRSKPFNFRRNHAGRPISPSPAIQACGKTPLLLCNISNANSWCVWSRISFFGKGRRIEHEHGVGLADGGGHLARQLVEKRLVVPLGRSEKRLQTLPFLIIAIGDGFGVFAFDIGQ